MKLRLISDLHTEFWKADNIAKVSKIFAKELPPLPTDPETTLVLAGDTGSLHRPTQYCWLLDIAAERFKHVVWVGGNHEWYGGSWVTDQKFYQKELDKRKIFYDFENEIEGVTFICTTLWTDFEKENPLLMQEARVRMNDYRQIEHLSVDAVLAEHKILLEKIRSSLEKRREKTVVVTHHAPSFQSIHDDYRTDRLNGCYASDLEYLMLQYEPAFWLHGHVHMYKNYFVGKTNVVCNPLGYRGYEKNNHKKELILEI